MKIAADTNVLVRILVADDPRQSAIAQAELERADLVAIATPVLCELVWVLSRGYDKAPHAIANAIRALMESDNVAVDRGAAEAGLAILEAGGDFADGAIVDEAFRMSASVFVSFDRKAVRLLQAQGTAARLL